MGVSTISNPSHGQQYRARRSRCLHHDLTAFYFNSKGTTMFYAWATGSMPAHAVGKHALQSRSPASAALSSTGTPTLCGSWSTWACRPRPRPLHRHRPLPCPPGEAGATARSRPCADLLTHGEHPDKERRRKEERRRLRVVRVLSLGSPGPTDARVRRAALPLPAGHDEIFGAPNDAIAAFSFRTYVCVCRAVGVVSLDNN